MQAQHQRPSKKEKDQATFPHQPPHPHSIFSQKKETYQWLLKPKLGQKKTFFW